MSGTTAGRWLALRRFGQGREDTGERERRLPTRPGETSGYDLAVPVNQKVGLDPGTVHLMSGSSSARSAASLRPA